MLPKLSFWWILVIFIASSLHAQIEPWQNPNLRQQQVLIQDSLYLGDEIPILSSFEILDENKIIIPSSLYVYNEKSNYLLFDSSLIRQNIQIKYYVYPNISTADYFKKDTTLIVLPQQENEFYTIPSKIQKNENIFGNLNTNGSLVRGLSFGNNQGSAVQSSLDLQITGKLSKSISINAAISDTNIPVETDGFTQNLQEFDRIYVELFNENSGVRAGQIDLIQQNQYFGNFTRKVTGLQLYTELGEENPTKLSLAGSFSRGEFAVSTFNGQDGNQGPYRLSGNNNETYIIIVSGSERVYMNGIQLQPGESEDYLINYNTGEIIFTGNQLITADSRIRVEYLYATRNYPRFTLYGNAEHQRKNWHFSAGFFSESDNKNNAFDELNDETIAALKNAGNNQDLMFITDAKVQAYEEGRVLYRQVTVGGNTYFEFSNDPAETLYQVNFSLVGNGNGAYEQTQFETNGRVFEYVGEGMGSYAPIRRLAAPERLQLLTFNSEYRKDKTRWGLNVGFSQKDFNLISDLDDENNGGLAIRTYAEKEWNWKKWQLAPMLSFSYIQSNFSPIERIYAPEFTRDFNLSEEIGLQNQTFGSFRLLLNNQQKFKSDYELIYLQNESAYQGVRHSVSANFLTEKTHGQTQISHLKSEADLENSTFFRHQTQINQKIHKKWNVGASYAGENNRVKNNLTGALDAAGFEWNELRSYIAYGDSTRFNAKITAYTRKDDSVRLGRMTQLQSAKGGILETQIFNTKNHRLRITAHFRSINYTERENADFLLGNINWYKSFLNNGLIINAFYELASGQEPQREFEYVKVNDGTGIYQWTDYNGDGIEQIDEFETAIYQDNANYIRVYTNTLRYVQVNYTTLKLSAHIRFKELLNLKKGFLSYLKSQVSWAGTPKQLKNGTTALFNPFVEDDLLLNVQNFRLNFNWDNEKRWDLNYVYLQNRNDQFLLTGTEKRQKKTHEFLAKYTFKEGFYALTNVEKSITNSNSSVFSSRIYQIDQWRLEPRLRFQSEKNWRIDLFYAYQDAINNLGEENLTTSTLGFESQWDDKKKTSLYAQFNWIKNDFTGNPNSVVGNQMMEGLKPGSNLVWQLQLQRQLSSFLFLNISYNGRKTPDNTAIHIGNVQLQARF